MHKSPIVMYGGAFNPPHMDHISKEGIVGRLLETVAEKILIIPTGERSDKGYHGISYHNRLEMLRLATEDFRGRVEVDTVCMDGYIDSTTLAQARYLRREYGYDVPQVFGADVAVHMREWDRTGFVAEKLPKIFVTRPGFEITGVQNYQTLHFVSRGFSSTDIRKDVARILAGKENIEALRKKVHSKVLDYILKNNLFNEVPHAE
ncbi:MAG: nicotinate (nicotinamide) nucleotide adenylyltransferase [Candidatus Altimarinota bacterium]